jgi:serine/threonine-protein kinase RsbW
MNDARQSKAALRINNTIDELTRVVEFVEAFGRGHALPAHAVNNLNLCLDELLSNTISYGYDGADPRVISLTLSLDGGYLTAEIEDDARPFDPRRRTPLPAARDIASRPIGGLGLRFVNALMEVIDYRFSDGYNRTTLKQSLQPPAAVRTRGPMVTIAEEHKGAVTIVDINGRLDNNTAKSFEEKLTGLFKAGRNRVVVDLKNLIYISSAGCRALLVAGRLAEKSEGQLALCNLPADVLRVFDLGGLTDSFAIYPSREEGLAKLA